MSERKVLQKYYPPDFDPSAIGRTRKPKDAPAASKLQQVRLMAPFSMKCTTCGEYIYKGRKFNARKETTDETYYAIKVIRFYIRCTRCSAEITFKTDPKNNDYASERGARRNFEPWREAKLAEETEEERLDRLEREDAERDKMQELEAKTVDAKTEMAIADKLDEIRTRNARLERGGESGAAEAAVQRRLEERDEARERAEREDEDAARRAFMSATGERVRRLAQLEDGGDVPVASGGAGEGPRVEGPTGDMAEKVDSAPTFERKRKRKQDLGAALGIKKKKAPMGLSA
ncbi:hypothetical protein FH972_024520 [Carpinus fangiana]|uniref:Splicing factor YJU2 n=1 Tax=Carpinus fangiana TaxID=176857 RepID=A0A5N6KYP8_9ROSI|nr:hypothetical protein FH972_024520 [Carpinus fangiana]